MMDIFDAIEKRRSVRRFNDKQVPEEVITKIVGAGQWAPSACNRQAWKYILIESKEARERFLKETTAYFVGKAPVLILILYSNRTDNLEYKDHLLSAAMSIQNMQLAAYSLGLGTCCVNNLPTKAKLRKIFDIPGHYDPVALLCMGYPKAVPGPLKRKEDLSGIMCKNRFDFNDDDPGIDMGLRIKRVVRFVYYRLPAFAKKILDPFARKFEKRFDK